jgi:chromosome segregation ATPase
MAQDPFQEVAADVRETKERVGRVEEQVGRLDERVGRIEQQVGRLDERVGRIEQQVGRLDERVGRIEQQIGRLDERVGRLEVHAQKAEADMAQVQQTLLRHDARFDAMDRRFDSLEASFTATLQKMNASLLGDINLALETFTRAGHEARIVNLERAVFGTKT